MNQSSGQTGWWRGRNSDLTSFPFSEEHREQEPQEPLGGKEKENPALCLWILLRIMSPSQGSPPPHLFARERGVREGQLDNDRMTELNGPGTEIMIIDSNGNNKHNNGGSWLLGT